MYQDRKIIVVGGGDSAIEEAVYLTKFASHVTIVHRSGNFRATRTALEEAQSSPKIKILTDVAVKKVNGQGHALTSVILENTKTKELTELPTEGAFVYIGTEPMTNIFKEQVETDKTGYIIAGEDTNTNIPGIFAAGDVRTKPIRQVVTAASDGAVAGIMAERYIVANKL
jgi:thioredoxin reductase (NADPH)